SAVAGGAVGAVTPGVVAVQRDVVSRVDVGRLDHAAVAIDAVGAAVAAEAVALLPTGQLVLRRKVGSWASMPRSEPEGTSGPVPPIAAVAAVTSLTRTRPSGSARWQRVQRALACGASSALPSLSSLPVLPS